MNDYEIILKSSGVSIRRVLPLYNSNGELVSGITHVETLTAPPMPTPGERAAFVAECTEACSVFLTGDEIALRARCEMLEHVVQALETEIKRLARIKK